MSIEGRLKIDLHRRGRKIDKVVIASSRPTRISRLFIGKTAVEALQTIPLVFSVCAMAQSCAATLACERATGCAEFEDTQNAREMIVMAESTREHLLRIALDWPQYISGRANPINVRAIMKLPENMRNALFASGEAFAIGARPHADKAAIKVLITDLEEFLKSEIFGEDIALWQRRGDFEALKDWAENTDTVPARLVRGILERGWMRVGDGRAGFLQQIDDREMLTCLLSDDAGAFVSQPTWNGAPLETSALSRQVKTPLIKALMRHCGTSLLTRISARLCELARLPENILSRLETDTRTVKPVQQVKRIGLAQIEAARGVLVHMVRIERGLVKDYRILAPTEWNFHPSGPAARALAQLDAASGDDLKMQAKLLINAIDPCVGFKVRVH